MTKEDQAAFNEWAGGTYDSDYNEIDIWQAACIYKDKRIEELEEDNARLRYALEDIAGTTWDYDEEGVDAIQNVAGEALNPEGGADE